MNKPISALAVVLLLGLGAPVIAASTSHSSHSSSHHSSSSHKSSGASKSRGSSHHATTHPKSGTHSSSAASHRSSTPSKAACATCKRDEHGKIARSEKAKDDFERQTGYPHGRPGFVVDHKVPLECGGADAPSNMQWQTAAGAKAKDRTERNCRK